MISSINTEIMAKEIEMGMNEAGVEVVVKRALDAKADELKDVDQNGEISRARGKGTCGVTRRLDVP